MKSIYALSFSLVLNLATPIAYAGQSLTEWLDGLGKDRCYELLRKKNYAEGIPVCEKMANEGAWSAQYNLGVHYENGWGVEKDVRAASNWYLRAAQAGYPVAQYNLGVLYRDGSGVGQDYSQAFRWFEKSAEQGYADSQAELATLYLHGRGTEANLSKTVQLFEMAAKNGNAVSQYNLGTAYMQGIEKSKDPVEAYAWLKLAELKGSVDAPSRLATLKQSVSKEQFIRGEARFRQYQKKYGKKNEI